MNHKEQLQAFINGLVAKGIPATKVQEITTLLLADDGITQYFSGGVLAQNLLDQKLNAVRTLETQLQSQQTQWNTYLNQANQTLQQAEQARLAASNQAAAADTAIKALAQQYQIPEEDVRAIYNPQSYQSQQQQQPLAPNYQQQQQPYQQQPNGFQQQLPARQQQQPQYLTPERFNETLSGVVNDLLVKDTINARHFELTGRPWNPSKAVDFIKQQAQLGRTVQLEEAWRLVEGIDQLEASAAEAAKKAERDQLEREIREKLASESTRLPTDAQPNFGEARLSSIFQQPQQPNGDGQQQQPKEQLGHHGRTREATSAFFKLQQARRLGQPSPYDQPATAPNTTTT
jgi:hypothetical protein